MPFYLHLPIGTTSAFAVMNLKGRDLKDRAAALQNPMPELSLAPGR